MSLCKDCESQKDKGRYDEPHQFLKVNGDTKIFRGMRTGGYEETPYVCKICGTKFIHSNDKNDNGWMLTT